MDPTILATTIGASANKLASRSIHQAGEPSCLRAFA
jgi:hypothetical protein